MTDSIMKKDKPIEMPSGHWRSLRVSQRMGAQKMPEQLDIYKITGSCRRSIWLTVDAYVDSFSRNCDLSQSELKIAAAFFTELNFRYYSEIKKLPHDEIPNLSIAEIEALEIGGFDTSWILRSIVPKMKDLLKRIILNGEYYETLDLLEIMFRVPKERSPKHLLNGIEKTINKETLYRLDRKHSPVCLLPSSCKEIKIVMEEALSRFAEAKIDEERKLINSAGRYLRNKRFNESTRDCILAVEAAATHCCPIDLEQFDKELDMLVKQYDVPITLVKSFKKIYGYTSSVPGVRHFNKKNNKIKLEQEEALFVYTICISFVDYLYLKRTKKKT